MTEFESADSIEQLRRRSYDPANEEVNTVLAVQRVINTLRRRSYDPANEEAVKFAILNPILQATGWKTDDLSEVLYEHSVGTSKAGGRVDIALRDNSQTHHKRIVALIEVKAPREDLHKHTEQVLGYAFHEGCDICVLTNGVEWWLFLPRERGRPTSRCFTKLHLKGTPVEQLVEDISIFLGKRSLTSGRAAQQAKRVLKAGRRQALLKQKIPEIWKNMQAEPDDELVELIVKRVYEHIDLRPEQSEVIEILHGRMRPGPSVQTSPQSTTTTERTQPSEFKGTSQTGTPQDDTKPRSAGHYLKPSMIRIFNRQYPARTWSAVFKQVATVLYEHHPYEYDRTMQELWRHETRTISPDRQQIRIPFRPEGARIWINMDVIALTLCERAGKLMEALGHNQADLEYQVKLKLKQRHRFTNSEAPEGSQNHLEFNMIENRWISHSEVIELLSKMGAR